METENYNLKGCKLEEFHQSLQVFMMEDLLMKNFLVRNSLGIARV